MTVDLTMLTYSVALYLVMVLLPPVLRARGWTPGGVQALAGNRDALPEASPMAGRAQRASVNMLEAMIMFAPLVLTARAAAIPDAQTALGAQIFFFARVAYLPIYVIGIPYLRTLVWTVSLVGMGMIASALF